MSSTASTKGRGHRSRGTGANSGLLAAAMSAEVSNNKKPSNAVAGSSVPPSNSEEVSSEESDSDSSYSESNDTDDETNGTNLKSGPCSIPPPRIKMRRKLANSSKNVIQSMIFA